MDRRQSIHRQTTGATLLSALSLGQSAVRPIAALFTAESDDISSVLLPRAQNLELA